MDKEKPISEEERIILLAFLEHPLNTKLKINYIAAKAGIWVEEEKGKVKDLARQARKMIGMTREEMIGFEMLDIQQRRYVFSRSKPGEYYWKPVY